MNKNAMLQRCFALHSQGRQSIEFCNISHKNHILADFLYSYTSFSSAFKYTYISTYVRTRLFVSALNLVQYVIARTLGGMN